MSNLVRMTKRFWNNMHEVNVREYRRGNQKWTIQRNWQQGEEKQSKNTTQNVLDTNMRKQTQIT